MFWVVLVILVLWFAGFCLFRCFWEFVLLCGFWVLGVVIQFFIPSFEMLGFRVLFLSFGCFVGFLVVFRYFQDSRDLWFPVLLILVILVFSAFVDVSWCFRGLRFWVWYNGLGFNCVVVLLCCGIGFVWWVAGILGFVRFSVVSVV